MTVTIEQFTQRLAAAGVIPDDDLHAWIAALPLENRPTDCEQLARELIRQRKLTKFQAEQIYMGNGASLTFGNYVILDKLGQGGMGMVLKAEHKRMKRVVALKVMSGAAMKSPDAVKRFHREVEAAARLSHPNIVAAFDADEDRGTHFLVMEYVAGSDLSQIVKQGGPLPLAKALDYTIQASKGLAHAHQQGLVHRDIKPANLLLDQKGIVKILDMGLARFDDSLSSTEGAANAGLTTTGTIMGTVDYMSPEQALDTKHADARSDIYSLGVTLFYLLTGRVPFVGDTIMKKLLAHREDPIPSLCEIRSDIPAELDVALNRLLAKKPAERFQTMDEVAAALQSIAQGRGISPTTVLPTSTASEPTGNTEFRNFLQGLDDQTIPGRTGTRSDTLATTGKRIPVTEVKSVERGGISHSGTKRAAKLPSVTMIAAGVAGVSIALVLLVLVIPGRKANPKPKDPTTASTESPEKSAVSTSKRLEAEKAALKWLFTAGAQVQLEGNTVVQNAEDVLASRKPVVSISLNQRPVKDDDLEHLVAFPELAILSLADCDIGDKGIVHAGRLLKLRSIDLTNTKISDFGLKAILSSHELTALSVSSPNLSASALETISQLPELTTLNAVGLPVTPEGLLHLQKLKKLNHLNLGSSPRFDDQCAESVAQIASLGGLWIMHSQIGRAGLKSLARLPDLRAINLDGCQNIDDACGVEFATFPALESLNVSHSLIGDRGLEELLKSPSINWLALHTAPITEASIPAFSRANQLATLNVQATRLSADAVKQLVAAMPWCQISTSHGEFSPSRQVSILTGPALEFDGEGYVEIPSLKWNGTDSVTIEVALTPDSTTGSGAANILIWPSEKMTEELAITEWEFQNWGFARKHSTGRQTNAHNPIRPNERVILTCAWDGQKTSMFVNGIPTVTQKMELLPNTGPTMLTIGGYAKSSFHGTIDQLRISKGVRPRLPNPPNGRLPKDDSTLALYHFEEGSGDQLKDSSGNNHHGKIIGAKWVHGKSSSRAIEINNRRAIEWVLSTGGFVHITVNGEPRSVSNLSDLPTIPFDFNAFEVRASVDDDSLQNLMGCEKLSAIGLNGCSKITDAGLYHLRNLKQLGNLSVFGAQHVSSEGLKHLANSRNMAFLHLGGTDMTDAGLEQLAKFRFLASVHLNGTKVTEAGVKKLAVSIPWCEIKWDGKTIQPTAANRNLIPDLHGLQFDGINSRVEIPVVDIDAKGPLTIEVWFTVEQKSDVSENDPESAFQAIWSGVNPKTKSAFQFHIDQRNAGWWFSAGDDNQTRTIFNNFPMDGERFDLYSTRHHAAFVRDGDEVRLYVDGQPKRTGGTVLDGNNPKDPAVRPLEIESFFLGAAVGQDGKTPDRFFRGVIEQFRFSSTARYTKEFVPADRVQTDESTLILYQFDEGTGDLLKDSSGHQRHGKIVGATWIKPD